mmetsp:Transcript_43833/g.103641  ORF Transcript_43833/g.103641 Transcript_43833/m.103641 type:complete len:453 (+) Transcript_43833:59-1417(+)
MGCAGSAPEQATLQEQTSPSAATKPEAPQTPLAKTEDSVPRSTSAPEEQALSEPSQTTSKATVDKMAARRKSEVERLKLPEGPDALSEEEWLAFQQVEIFDSCEVEVGSKNGSSFGNLVFKVDGGRTFRFTIDNLPPALEGPSECPFEMDHPMAVMRGDAVKGLTEVISHSEAQMGDKLLNLEFEAEAVFGTMDLGLGGCLDRRKHVVLPKVLPTRPMIKRSDDDNEGEEERRKVLNPLRRIVYIAHRWQGHSLSDPAQLTTLNVVQDCVADQDYVWMDFWSVPTGSAAAISSMQAYVFRATMLIAAAVSKEDLRRFMDRTWCQVELFAALCPVVADRMFAIVGSDRGDSMRSVVFKHACEVQVQVLGKPPADLDFEQLKNPLTCGISNKEDLELLVPALVKIRDALREARPSTDSDTGRFDTAHEKVTGIPDSIVSQMLMALGNCRLPKLR